MPLNEIILKLEKSGDLQKLFKAGFISSSVLLDKDIYLTYQTNLTTCANKTQAVYETAEQFKVGDNKIWRAIKRMEQPQ